MAVHDSTLVERLEETVGDGLRGVVRYERGDIDVLFMRDSLAGSDSRDEPKHEVLQAVTGGVPPDSSSFGAHRASVHVFEDVTAIHVPTEDGCGYVATVDTGTTAWTSLDALVDVVSV